MGFPLPAEESPSLGKFPSGVFTVSQKPKEFLQLPARYSSKANSTQCHIDALIMNEVSDAARDSMQDIESNDSELIIYAKLQRK
jgi:hypothetical protein